MKTGPAIALAFSLAPGIAFCALYQGRVAESLHGMGVDSVKVGLQGDPHSVYTDSTGRFTLEAGTTRAREAFREPEIIWRARSRTLSWSAGVGSLSLAIRDARGHKLWMGSAGGRTAGGFAVPGLGTGIHFADLRSGGRKWTWHWFEDGGSGRSPAAAFPQPGDAAFIAPTGGSAPARKKATESTDTLVFEKKGFETRKLAVPASAVDLRIGMRRLPIRVLIVDGMSNHDWRQTTRVAKAVYAKAGFFQVEVSTAPDRADAAAWQAWQPDFSRYEMVLLNYNSGDAAGSLRWPSDRERALEEFVRAGGGLYALHAANNSFPQWAAYNRMIGTGWRRKDFGAALEVDASGRVVRIPAGTGGDTRHGARADVLVRLLHPHPIHKGYPPAFLAAALEIYQFARGPAEECRVLSYAFDGPASGNSNRSWPIELMVDYGAGRIYNSTMGHVWAGETQPAAVRDAAFQTALIRASEWLARREVLYPVPREFNDSTRIVYSDLDLE